MLRVYFVALFMCINSVVGVAQSPSSAESAEFQRIIAAQISAFKADDGKGAYDFAAPVVRRIFPSVESFMAMVKKGYPQVYRPQSFAFKETMTDPLGRPAQKVLIVGPDGKSYVAVYTMEKQADGSWLISGCAMLEIPGLDA